MEIWEPKLPGTLWATPGLLRDCFTFYQRRTWTQCVSLLSFTAFNSACHRSVLYLLYFSLIYKTITIQNYNFSGSFMWL